MNRLRSMAMRLERSFVLAAVPRVARLVLSYGVVAWLAFALLWAVVRPSLFGEAPRPRVPPDGWESESLTVELAWERGDTREAVDLQVAVDRDFSRLFFEKSVRGERHRLVGLARGRTYYWRLGKDDGATTAWFQTSERAVAF